MNYLLRLLLTLFTILCGTTISGASIQEPHAGAVFEKTCVVFEGETPFSAEFVAPNSALGNQMGKFREVLQNARTQKGNFGLGSGTRAEAVELGQSWVGKGFRTASDGKTLVSKDGLRTFRPPSAKPNSPYASTGVQANFERLERVKINGVYKNRVISNGHLDITP